MTITEKDMLERHGCLLGHGPSELGATPRPSNVEPNTPTPKRGRNRPAPHSRNDQDVPSGKKTLERLNTHSLGEQSVLGGARPGKRTRFCCFASLCVFLVAWGVKCHWIVVAKSVGTFTRCSEREYLRL